MRKRQKNLLDLEQFSIFVSEKSKHNRNRLILLLLFSTYSLLAVLGTTDIDLFFENPITLPLFNIKLPLLAFYICVPLFIVTIHFFSIKMHVDYINYLLSQKKKNIIKDIPLSIFDMPYIYDVKYLKFLIGFVIYGLPLISLEILYFRFTDYQSSALSNWHSFLVFTDVAILIFISKKRYKLRLFSIPLGSIVFLYHNVFFADFISKPEQVYNDYPYLAKYINTSIIKYGINISEIIIPRLTIDGENFNNYNIETLKEYKKISNSKNDILSFTKTKKFIGRNFLYMYFTANLVKADFEACNFTGSLFIDSILNYSFFKQTIFSQILFNNCSLSDSSFYLCSFDNAKFIMVKFKNIKILSSNINSTKINLSIMDESKFIDTNLSKSQIIYSSLRANAFMKTRLNDINLSNNDLTGSVFENVVFNNISFNNSKMFYTFFNKTNIYKNTNFVDLSNILFNSNMLSSYLDLMTTYKDSFIREVFNEKPNIKYLKQELEKLIDTTSKEWIEKQVGIIIPDTNITKDNKFEERNKYP